VDKIRLVGYQNREVRKKVKAGIGRAASWA
jgi:hypothetical protein